MDLEDAEEAEARQAMAEVVAAFAAARGFDLTAADLLAANAAVPERELSDDELKVVAGGRKCGCVIIGALKSCGCFIGGGARHEGNFWNSFVCPFTIGFE